MSDYIEIKKECLLTWLDKQNIQCDCGTTNLYEELLDYTDEIAKNRYQQGRADKYKEITSEYMLLTEKQVAEIRADAIDEMKKILNSKNATINYSEQTDKNTITMFSKDSNWLAEQLKEQK